MGANWAASVIVVVVVVMVRIVTLWMRSRRRRHIESVEGKHVVITGGSSGIGLALAKLCLLQGASVTLIARNPTRLSHAAHLLSTSLASPTSPFHNRVLLKAADVSDATAVAAAIVESFEWKPIDILVCNAGTAIHGFFDCMKVRELDSVTRTNVLGCAYPLHVALPLMKARSLQHPSSIVLMGSLSSLLFVSGANMYTPTKYAVKGLAELLRFELMPHNIKVSLVCPGFTETPMLDEADKAALTTALVRKLTFYDRAHCQSADEVAAKTMEGVKKGEFLITTNVAGFLVGVLGRGFVPADSLARALLELLLLIPLRLCSFVWFSYAKRIIRNQELSQSHCQYSSVID